MISFSEIIATKDYKKAYNLCLKANRGIGRFIPLLKESPKYYWKYLENILFKTCGDLNPLTMESYINDYVGDYVRNNLKGKRWVYCEEYILKNNAGVWEYLTSVMKGNWPRLEKLLSEGYHFDYIDIESYKSIKKEDWIFQKLFVSYLSVSGYRSDIVQEIRYQMRRSLQSRAVETIIVSV